MNSVITDVPDLSRDERASLNCLCESCVKKAHQTRLFFRFKIALNEAYLCDMKMRLSVEYAHCNEKRRERNNLEKALIDDRREK